MVSVCVNYCYTHDIFQQAKLLECIGKYSNVHAMYLNEKMHALIVIAEMYDMLSENGHEYISRFLMYIKYF